MRTDKIVFRGVAVGLQLTAENPEERRLLWALRNLPAKANETYGMKKSECLFLCPSLPFLDASILDAAENAEPQPE